MPPRAWPSMVQGAPGPATLFLCFTSQAFLLASYGWLNRAPSVPSPPVASAAELPPLAPAEAPPCPATTTVVQVRDNWWTVIVFWGTVFGVGFLAFLAGAGCQSLLVAGGGTLTGAAIGALGGAGVIYRARGKRALANHESDSAAGSVQGEESISPLRW